MKNFCSIATIAVILFATSSSLQAQDGNVDGCTDSPENPTAVLALAGSAGAFLSYVRLRTRSRKESNKG